MWGLWQAWRWNYLSTWGKGFPNSGLPKAALGAHTSISLTFKLHVIVILKHLYYKKLPASWAFNYNFLPKKKSEYIFGSRTVENYCHSSHALSCKRVARRIRSIQWKNVKFCNHACGTDLQQGLPHQHTVLRIWLKISFRETPPSMIICFSWRTSLPLHRQSEVLGYKWLCWEGASAPLQMACDGSKRRDVPDSSYWPPGHWNKENGFDGGE